MLPRALQSLDSLCAGIPLRTQAGTLGFAQPEPGFGHVAHAFEGGLHLGVLAIELFRARARPNVDYGSADDHGPGKEMRNLHQVPGLLERVRTFQSRSEERRVGKECRSRWSPY